MHVSRPLDEVLDDVAGVVGTEVTLAGRLAAVLAASLLAAVLGGALLAWRGRRHGARAATEADPGVSGPATPAR